MLQIWFIDKAFEGSNIYTVEDIPDDIDVMVLSHDHWDHLDYDMVRKIEPKVRCVVTGLGNGGYYEKWGYPPEKIREEDWDMEVVIDKDLSVWVLPAKHFSGRLLPRNQTLFAGFAFITPDRKVYFSGFDLALVEDGQYNEAWHSVHMMPEESALAGEELQAAAVIPCSNGKYLLSVYRWKEPYERIAEASKGKSYRLIMPMIGELVEIGNREQTFTNWWEGME